MLAYVPNILCRQDPKQKSDPRPDPKIYQIPIPKINADPRSDQKIIQPCPLKNLDPQN